MVDDDVVILTMMSRLLKSKGIDAFPASSAVQALELLKKQIPDLILSDFVMPDMDGFKFRQILLKDPQLRDIPFVFLTSQNDNSNAAKALEMMAIDYIDKNTPINLVVNKLVNILISIQKQHEQSLYEIGAAAKALNLRSVPDNLPRFSDFRLEYLHQTFENYLGGDFVDFIETGNGQTFLFIGDVMGKKWGAWFFSFNFLSYIRSAIRFCIFEAELSTQAIVSKINRVLNHDPVLQNVLSTLSLILIDHKNGKITYTGAGDMPLLLFKSNERKLTEVRSGGLLLGALPEGMFDQQEFIMEKGDILLAFTDGMTDCKVNGEAKTNYLGFVDRLRKYFDEEDPFEEMKEKLMDDHICESVIDDRSLLYIEKL